MKGKKKYFVWSLALVALSLLFFSCGGSSNTTSGSSSSSATGYNAYSVGKGKQGATTTTPDVIVVLPASAAAPANAQPIANANVTFLQESGSSDSDSTAESISVTADANGHFEIPTEVEQSSNTEDSQPEVVVSDPNGNAVPVGTTLAVADVDDGSESPLSLKIIPKEFKMVAGEFRVFHALQVMPSGKVVHAKNVTWNCDASGNGVLTEAEKADDGSFLVCKSTASGSATVTASVNAGGGLDDTAKGEVIAVDKLVTVTGTLFDSSDKAVGKGYMVNFDLPPVIGEKAFHFAAPTDTNGKYKAYLPAPTDPNGVAFHLLVGDPTAKQLYTGLELTSNSSTYKILPADAGLTKSMDLKIGIAFVPIPPPPPAKRIIREAWHQVHSAIRPRYFEPFHGIRLLFADTVADGSGQIKHRGMFHGWCYEKSGSTVTITPPFFSSTSSTPTCPNTDPFEKVVITANASMAKRFSLPTSYSWVKSIKPKGSTTFQKIKEGEVTDTVSTSAAGNRYISDILAKAKHFSPDDSTHPILTSLWTWSRTLAQGETDSDEVVPATIKMSEKVCSGINVWSGTIASTACGSGIPMASYEVTRNKEAEPTSFDQKTLIFTFFGTAAHYFKEPDGNLKEVADTICSSSAPCEIYTDHSGSAQVDSTDGKVKVSFTLLPFNDSSNNIAEGTLLLTIKKLTESGVAEVQKKITFTIDRLGNIKLTLPDGTTESFDVAV